MAIEVDDIPADEIIITATLASGPGGQHVNKVETAIQLQFDIPASSLPPAVKSRFQGLKDRRISSRGVLTIKSGQHRSRERNRQAVLERFSELLHAAQKVPKKRRTTKPTKASIRKRLDHKTRHGEKKKFRSKPDDHS